MENNMSRYGYTYTAGHEVKPLIGHGKILLI